MQTDIEWQVVESSGEEISVVRGRQNDVILRTVLMLRFLRLDSITGSLESTIHCVCVCARACTRVRVCVAHM